MFNHRVSPVATGAHKTRIESAEGAIKILLVINGGAAVSVLAFVGGLASQEKISMAQIDGIAESLVYFGLASEAQLYAYAYST